MQNLIIIAIVAVILGSAVFYIRKEKKKGTQCIGCPDAAKCSGKCSGYSGNSSGNTDK